MGVGQWESYFAEITRQVISALKERMSLQREVFNISYSLALSYLSVIIARGVCYRHFTSIYKAAY